MKVILLFALCFPASVFAWTKTIDKDKMTDEVSVVFMQPSLKPVFASKKATLSIFVKCSQSAAALMILDPWIIADGPVDMRIDKTPAFTTYAQPGAGHKVEVIGDPSASDDTTPSRLIKKIQAGKRLIVRYHRVGDSLVEAEFNISGLTKNILEYCPKSKKEKTPAKTASN